MRKTDRKLENNIRIALTSVCEEALKQIHGFQWLTHFVNYEKFPSSLKVICIFDSNENLTVFNASEDKIVLIHLIQTQLKKIDIIFKHPQKQLHFDTEENCLKENNGDWAKRW